MTTHDFHHRYLPGRAGRTLLLLHGTGGDEDSLLPLGRALDPEAGLLAPRGRVLEGRMPRFFRRLAEGVFDLEDLHRRTTELAGFIRAAAREYGFAPERLTAVGFSNGANIAASLLLADPAVLPAAVLLRAMVPFEPAAVPQLEGHRIWIGAGRADPIVPPEHGERLAALFRRGGADVTLDWRDAGHNLVPEEVAAAAHWLGPA